MFSPLMLTALVSVLEIIIFLAIYTVSYILLETISDSIIWGILFRAITFIFEASILLTIIYRNEDPEYKIPWIVFLIFFPALTFIIYLIFANHGLRKQDKKIIDPTYNYLSDKFALNTKEVKEFQDNVPIQYRTIFRYLRHVTHLHNSNNNEITYYKNGETFFPALVESIKNAKEFIFLEFFIIGEGYWWSQIEEILIEKAKQGIEVRVIYDDLGSFGVLPNSYHKKLRKQGIKCYKFHPFKPRLSGLYNNRDHRKIAIIDHEEAYTGGMNLADEYANTIKRFGYWKDTMIKIKGPGIANLIATFLENYQLAEQKLNLEDFDKYINYDYKHYDSPGYIYFFGDGPGAYSNNQPIGEENYMQLIQCATRSIWISTPYLIPTFRLRMALKSAAMRSIDVKLFVPGIPDKKLPYLMARSEFEELVKAGIKIYLYKPGFNHEKQMVVDDRIAFCGTINFDFRSLTHHFECGATLYDVPCIQEMVEDFKEMESVSEPVPPRYRLPAIKKIFIALVKLIRPLL